MKLEKPRSAGGGYTFNEPKARQNLPSEVQAVYDTVKTELGSTNNSLVCFSFSHKRAGRMIDYAGSFGIVSLSNFHNT